MGRHYDNLMTNFEEEYEDVLQNIEFAIMGVYREHPELVDSEVEKAVNALILTYQAEMQRCTPSPVSFTPLGQQVYVRVQSMCEWRLGRKEVFLTASGEHLPKPEPLSLEAMIACLKRIRKSVQTWTRREGRQGYLCFVEEFFPYAA